MPDTKFVVRGLDFADSVSVADVEQSVAMFNSRLKAVNIKPEGPNYMPEADIVGSRDDLIVFLDDYFEDCMTQEAKLEMIVPYDS